MSTTDQDSIGQAIGRIAAGVFIVTAQHDDESTGLLASWVQQASFQPPLISVAVKAGRPIRKLLDAGAAFAVNVVGAGQKSLTSHFAKGFKLEEPAFEGLETTTGVTGAPILPEALAYMECRVHGKTVAGDHVVYFGEVVAGAVNGSARPEVRLRKSGFVY